MTMDPKDLAKKRTGEAAAQLVKDGMMVGLGTGSTAAFMIAALGQRVREEGLKIIGVPTSFQSVLLARKEGIPTIPLDEAIHLDIAIDGADEVDPQKNLIKGGGAAHTREKIVAAMADYFVVIVDDSKLVDKLNTTFALPVEVLPLAAASVTKRLEEMGAKVDLRMAIRKGGPVITDQGNFVLDITFPGGIDDPVVLEYQLNNIPGVLENGLFVDLANLILVARTGQEEVQRIE
jgi:ribose 5-phosphate isomerase A